MTIKYLHEFLVEYLELDRGVQRLLRKKLEEMHRVALEAYPHQALTGAQFKGLFKLRVGDWRLVYKIADGEVLFVTLGHRSEIYQ
ncbi:MAG: type II toxin-antitoxin system RelE/ParE family toxin [Myxococcales bacterium]|nr:type II toxin-antitoxin system RelE/ParE family toxin [Myxococcales bacterium]